MTNINMKLLRLIGIVALATSSTTAIHAVPLADAPLFSTMNVPGNLALALSVEYPTAISVANLGDYVHANTYLGYFDPDKCYSYTFVKDDPDSSYFQPAGKANNHTCSSKWSGNFMNWVSMQTIDPFRWALTGGYRATDTSTTTILQKAYGSAQGSASGNYPYRGTDLGTGNKLTGTDVVKVTPMTGARFNTRLWGKGIDMVFSTANSTNYQNDSPSNLKHYGDGTSSSSNYYVKIRVKVCENTTASGGLESNCTRYGNNYKPEGLMQKYSDKIRYSAFGYLNQGGASRQGGVLRAKMGFIGPTQPVAMSTTPETNATKEWDGTTGIMVRNPDSALATASSVSNSGVMNYLNQFGNYSKGYMSYDNVSEMYYAAVRYFQNKGNVPEWTNGATLAQKDNFPAATNWSDPIIYSCQKNFILGIGDSNTHYDVATPQNNGIPNAVTRAVPALVTADNFNKSWDWTGLVENAEGDDVKNRYRRWGSSPGSEFIAGLAYGNHVFDIRPETGMPGKQTIETYWMDVMEGQYAQDKNPYWLAAKYGGFKVPDDFDPANPALAENTWSSGESITMYPRGQFSSSNPNSNTRTRLRPKNYFLAGNAGQMVQGLTNAFNSIAASVNAYTTAVTPTSNVISASGTTSYSASYGSEYWTGTVKAATLAFTSAGSSLTDLWSTDTSLQTQFAGTGWNTGRVVITWDKNHATSARGVPFRTASLSATLKTALDTTYVAGDDSSNYLNYLRGDKTNEVGTSGGTNAYRMRMSPLGDIVNSKIVLSTAPKMPYTEAYNLGYAAYKTAQSSRTPLVLFGANDGMLHALNGSTTGTNAGKEVFAYIPGQTFYGPDGTTSTQANSNGLAAIGNPAYVHRYYVDATPQVFDIDFKSTNGSTLSDNTWKTIVVGGLGKGGKGFYAIDITNPSDMSTETSAAGKVLWEISNTTTGFSHLGYSYGSPIMVKTAKYGWTLILTSGYNNDDDLGYLFLVNPATGALLETISTGAAAPGLAQASAFINDYTNGTADAVYVGDLNGKLWRFDLTKATGAYDTPVVLFQTASPDTGAQPITVAPIPEIHPNTRARTILFGTGKLLDGQDISLSQRQSFYAVLDGDNKVFAPAPTSALTRAELTQVSSLTTAVTLPADSRGWYYDLGVTNNIAWRIVVTPTAADGVALFTATLTSGDACSPAGQGRAYAVDYARGFSVLKNPNNNGEIVEFVALNSSPTDNVLFKVDGVLRGLIGDATGQTTELKLNTPGALGVRLINWREIKAVN
ncbi:pilus assembly protein [Comamonas sp.]|uniref:pilus assembly protein n=1 Tax=Comamonas sp. TaxID=34028 RepID=UPI00289B619E|nr:PilC/PilY family type IV pilus protein [Comamonas sp.]